MRWNSLLIEVAADLCEVDEKLGGDVWLCPAFVFQAALAGLESNAEEPLAEPTFGREVMLHLRRVPLAISGVNMGNEGAASIWAD